MVKRLIYLSVISLCCACTRELDVSYPNTPMGNFEALWNIIDTKYCFVEEKGVDWNNIHEEYRNKADTLQNDDERGLFKLLASMLDSLQDGHVNLYSSFDVSRNQTWYEGYPANFNSQLLYSEAYLSKNYMQAGGLQYQKIANGQIGLIRYSSFSDSFTAMNMLYVLQYFSKCKGLVIDVRSNGGGSMENAYKLASTFFTENTTVGYWQHKTGPEHNAFSALREMRIDTLDMPCKWLRPTIILCNRTSYSATNFFVNAMRYADNALIIGGRTGGGGGMPLSYELPNGWLVRFSSIKMYDAEKQSIESGIAPHKEITLVSEDKDDIIEYAIKTILDD